MGQITQQFAADMLERVERGLHPAFTVWEAKQLLTAWLDRERMREALTVARDTFALYAERHHEKGTPDGDTKAALNADLALRMAAVMTPNLN